MRRYFFLALVLMLAGASIGMNAATVDVTEARNVAGRFLGSRAAGKLMRAVPALSLAYTEVSTAGLQQADYYVFNASDGGAFVIVAGDDRAEPVLGYGEGSLVMSNLPCNLECLLAQYKEQMEWLHANPAAKVGRNMPVNDVTIAPLLSSNWSQSSPYYNQCPFFQGERSVTGCVATAMAQVMYYWKYPKTAPALSGYTTRSHRISVSSLPAKNLDWANMLDDYAATPYTDVQADAVATLMRYCGQSVRMDYSPMGSGAYVDQQLDGMKRFGYNPASRQVVKNNITYDDWDALLQVELLNGRPILYSANDPAGGGHAFVLDGYYDGKYHINWGWGGNYDGYFALGAFNVRGYKFLASQEYLSDMYPMQEADVDEMFDFEADGIYYRYGDKAGEAWVTCRDTRYNSYIGDVIVPERVTVDGEELLVTAIGDNAFRDCGGLTSVTLPQSLTRIGALAFRNCYNLSAVDIPQQVSSIGLQAFAACLALESITLPQSVTQVAARAFVGCESLKTVHTPSTEAWLGITFADRYANPISLTHSLLVDGNELEHLVVPATTGAVSPYAFIDCYPLKSVAIEEGVSQIGASAFAYCSGLTELTMPQTMTSLGSQAFIDCKNLTRATVPEGIEKLPASVFSGCARLASVTLPSTLTAIGNNAFQECGSLDAVTIPQGVTSIGDNAFKSCGKIKSINLPDALTTIGESAFESCSALTTVTVPDQVQVVRTQAFYRCSALNKLTLGKSVTNIDLKAFADCKQIASVTCRGEVPPEMANPDCFVRSIYRSATLYVPIQALSVYGTTGVWPWFTSMVGIDVDAVHGDVNGDGEVNIADVNVVIDAILADVNDPAIDVNGDGEVNIADVNEIIDIINGK